MLSHFCCFTALNAPCRCRLLLISKQSCDTFVRSCYREIHCATLFSLLLQQCVTNYFCIRPGSILRCETVNTIRVTVKNMLMRIRVVCLHNQQQMHDGLLIYATCWISEHATVRIEKIKFWQNKSKNLYILSLHKGTTKKYFQWNEWGNGKYIPSRTQTHN